MAKEAPKPPEYKPPEWLEEKRKELETTVSSVEELQKKIERDRETRLKARAKEDICFWMDNAIFPFLEGIAESFNEPLIPGIQRLIREKKNPFRAKEDGWNRTRETEIVLRSFLVQPQTRVLQVLARPYIKARMEWIHEKAEWIREEIVKEEYPGFYTAIMETEGGKEWLDELITDFVTTLRKLSR